MKLVNSKEYAIEEAFHKGECMMCGTKIDFNFNVIKEVVADGRCCNFAYILKPTESIDVVTAVVLPIAIKD